MLTKEECAKALEHIKTLRGSNYGWYYSGFNNSALPFDEDINVVQELMHEHFDNPPLKFEELKEGMWIWDNKHKVYNQIYRLYGNFMSTKHNAVQFKHLNETTQWGDTIEFEKNRFYRKEVQE